MSPAFSARADQSIQPTAMLPLVPTAQPLALANVMAAEEAGRHAAELRC
jgi:hypothetical protein